MAKSYTIHLTGLSQAHNRPATKIISLDDQNRIHKDSSPAANLSHAYADPLLVPVESLPDMFNSIETHQAILPGYHPSGKRQLIVPSRLLIAGTAPSGAISRTQENFPYSPGISLATLDSDRMSMLQAVFIALIIKLMPELGRCPRVQRASTGSCLYDARTDECIVGEVGYKTDLVVDNGLNIPQIGQVIYDQLELAGHGYYIISKTGTLLHRNLIDLSVLQGNHIDFCADAVCKIPVTQKRTQAVGYNLDAPPLDTEAVLKKYALSQKQAKALQHRRKEQRDALAPEANRQKENFIAEKITSLVADGTCRDKDEAQQKIRSQMDTRTLEPDCVVILDDGTPVLAADIRANPDQYNGRRCHDPVDPDYPDNRIGYITATPKEAHIFSHAHGGNSFHIAQNGDELPWLRYSVPEGYDFADGWLNRYTSSEKKIKISKPLAVIAHSISLEGKNAGLQMQYQDCQGNTKTCFIRTTDLMHDNALNSLVDGGFIMIPSKKKDVQDYLMIAADKNKQIRLNTPHLGWQQKGDESIYVTPTETVSRTPVTVDYLPQGNHETAFSDASGTVDEWRRNVAEKTIDYPFLVFGLCIAFSSLLLYWFNHAIGGFHFFGNSSKGKTTLLQVIASVFGYAGDPESKENGKNPYIVRWNSTLNGMESLAAAHNDRPLCIDEVGSTGGIDFSPLIYMLAGGEGKKTMTQTRDLRAVKTWRSVVISTGEVSMQDKIEEAGKKMKAGQAVRFLDIHCADRIFKNIVHYRQILDPSPEVLAKELKEACKTYYGTAGTAFIKYLLLLKDSDSQLKDHLQQLLGNIQSSISERITSDLSAEQKRVIDKLSIVGVAGVLASDCKLIPQSRQQILDAIVHMADFWVNDNTDIQDSTRAESAIRTFLLTQVARICKLTGTSNFSANLTQSTIQNIAGYIKDDEYWIIPEVLQKEVLSGYNIKSVCTQLIAKNIMFNDKDRYTSRRTIEKGKRINFYVISTAILDEEEKDDDSDWSNDMEAENLII